MPLFKLLELICSFLKFSIKCSPEEEKNNAVKKLKNEIKEDENKKICEIIMTPMENCLNIFDIDEHYKLFELLNYNNKKKITIEIINNLVNNINNKNLIKIDSIENFQKIIKYIQSLLTDSKNKEKILNNKNIILEEQKEVCKLLYLINSQSPEIVYEIFIQFKNIFSYGGQIRRKFSLPSLVNTIISFSHKLIFCYEHKTNKIPKNININKKMMEEIIKSINTDKITNDDIFIKIMSNIFKLLNETINLISQENAEIGFKLNIYCASLMNEINLVKEKFSEFCLSFINKALDLLELNPNLNKVNLIQYLSSFLINYNTFIKIDEEMESREEQFKLILIISKLYYELFKDSKKVNECLIKARRFADFEMTISKNIFLYIDLINIMIYFVEKENNIIEIKKEQIEDLIELVKGHIKTIKINKKEKNKNSKIGEEKYFVNTLDILKKRKNHKNEKLKEFYLKISS